MLLVVAIIAILAAILIPNFLRARTNAQVSASKSGIHNLAVALETYYVDMRAYPSDVTLNVLVAAGYIRAVPTDACTNQAFVYTPTGSTYVMSSPSWAVTPCVLTANGISWTPEGGLVQY